MNSYFLHLELPFIDLLLLLYKQCCQIGITCKWHQDRHIAILSAPAEDCHVTPC